MIWWSVARNLWVNRLMTFSQISGKSQVFSRHNRYWLLGYHIVVSLWLVPCPHASSTNRCCHRIGLMPWRPNFLDYEKIQSQSKSCKNRELCVYSPMAHDSMCLAKANGHVQARLQTVVYGQFPKLFLGAPTQDRVLDVNTDYCHCILHIYYDLHHSRTQQHAVTFDLLNSC